LCDLQAQSYGIETTLLRLKVFEFNNLKDKGMPTCISVLIIHG
jgi:hypothetical protein